MAKDSCFKNLNFVPVGKKLPTRQQSCIATNSESSVNDSKIVLTDAAG